MAWPLVCPTPLPKVKSCTKGYENEDDQAPSYCFAGIALSLFLKELLSDFGKLTITGRAVLDVRPNGIVEGNLAKSQRFKDGGVGAADPLRIRVSGSP